ncbi:PAAR domain-containing protein [Escherichia fergusonii]|uniref:PAAR domain-containing protein n=1 Tax=Escherichia fergusonii TaxID=564 RepID=UPI001CBC9E29|nr:PAAR domain-containing protein [Escherichia fergusonii]
MRKRRKTPGGRRGTDVHWHEGAELRGYPVQLWRLLSGTNDRSRGGRASRRSGGSRRGQSGLPQASPQPVQYLAEGSSQVSINDLPAVRSGDRTTCGGTVSTVVSPNVIIGGKPVVVRPIHNGKIPGVEVTLLALSLVTCRPSKFLKQLPCLLMGMAAATMASKLGKLYAPCGILSMQRPVPRY